MNLYEKQLQKCCLSIPQDYPPLEVMLSEPGRLVFKPHLDRDEYPYTEEEIEDLITLVSPPEASNQEVKDEAEKGFQQIRHILPVGSKAPNFELLQVPNNTSTKLSDLSGCYVAIMFIAITCPPARIQINRWNKLAEDFAEQDVRFLFIYSKERHAGEGVFKGYQNITSEADRWKHAAEIAKETQIPVLIDDNEETTLSNYGKVPNQALVINKTGDLVYKSTWANSVTIQQVLCESLRYEGKRGTGQGGLESPFSPMH